MGLVSPDLYNIRMAFTHYFSGTGEHGVGIGKREYLYEELGEGTVELMRTIKRAVDPLNLFNPGKVGHLNDRHGSVVSDLISSYTQTLKQLVRKPSSHKLVDS